MSEEYSKEQYNALKYSNEQFDKSIQFIASGALGISFAFIEKIVKLENAICKCWLITSWYIFTIVIFISLVTHFISVMANRWAIQNLYENNDSSEIKNNYRRRSNLYWNYPIRLLNILMIIGVLAGLMYLIKFINENL